MVNILQEQIQEADQLAVDASALSKVDPKQMVTVEIVTKPSISESACKEGNTIEERVVTWTTLFVDFLSEGRLPDEPTEASKVRAKA